MIFKIKLMMVWDEKQFLIKKNQCLKIQDFLEEIFTFISQNTAVIEVLKYFRINM